MPYISELLNNEVHDSSDRKVGKLKDILIRPKNGSFSPLEFLVVRTKDGDFRYIPYRFVANFTSSDISLKGLFNTIALAQLPAGQYTYLGRDVLDQQIVDVAGTRVVRVNDLRIGDFEDKMCVLAIDSSFRGILRRLGLERFWFSRPFSVHLIDWRQAQLLGGSGKLQLNTLAEHLSRLHPADMANVVEELDVRYGSGLLASLDEKEAAKVLEEVDPRWQSILVKYLGTEKASKILAQMSTDEMADLIKSFSSEEADTLLSQVGSGKAKTVEKLISYPDNTAGGLMATELVTARPDWTVKQAIEEVRKMSESMRSVGYVYVTNVDGTLVGVVSLRRLLLASPDDKMEALVKPLTLALTLRPYDKVRKIIKLMTKYNLYNAAVLDKNKKLLGVVTIDDVMREMFPYA